MSSEAGQVQVRVRQAFQSMYPDLAPGQWYAIASRAGDDTRPQGASNSGGGPTPSAGVWVSVGDAERSLFRHHVEFRTASEAGADDLDGRICLCRAVVPGRLNENDGQSPGLESVIGYLRAIMLHTPFAQSLAASPTWTANFDVEGGREAGYARPLEEHRLRKPVDFHTRVDDAKRALILSRIAMFGEHPAGLGKFTRTMFSRDFRRTLVRPGEMTESGQAA